MKKLIALLCLLAICLPLAACASQGLNTPALTKEETKTKEEKNKEENEQTHLSDELLQRFCKAAAFQENF